MARRLYIPVLIVASSLFLVTSCKNGGGGGSGDSGGGSSSTDTAESQSSPPPKQPSAGEVEVPEDVRPFLGKWLGSTISTTGGRLVLEFRANGTGGYFVDIGVRNANGITELLVSGQFKVASGTEVEFDFPAAETLKSQYSFADKKIVIDGEEYVAWDQANLSTALGYILGRVFVQEERGGGAGLTSLAVGAKEKPRLPDSFVPGEMVVTYRSSSGPVPKTLKRLRTKLLVDVEDSEPIFGNEHLVKVRPLAGASKALRKMTSLSAFALGYRDYIEDLKNLTLDAIDEMNGRPDVERAIPNLILQTTGARPAEYNGTTYWNLAAINATAGWSWLYRWAADDGTKTFQNNLANIVVAVIDSGMHSTHRDLDGVFLSDGFDFVPENWPGVRREGGAAIEFDFDSTPGPDADPTDPGSQCPEDSAAVAWHGTHVSGIIGAKWDDRGAVGVAPGVKILPVRVAGRCGRVDLVAYQRGILYAAGFPVPVEELGARQTSHPADVINLSLRIRRSELEQMVRAASEDGWLPDGDGNEVDARGEYRRICGRERPESLNEAIQGCVDALGGPIRRATGEKGVVVVAAAGNDAWRRGSGGRDLCHQSSGDMAADPSYPASFDSVISVAAFDKNEEDEETCYSNYGDIDFSAPGGWVSGIRSSVGPGDNYEELAGTSQASPHVAGIVALLKAIHTTVGGSLFTSSFSNVSSTEFYRVLRNAASLRSAEAKDRDIGWGVINIERMLKLATGLEAPARPSEPPIPPPPVAPPAPIVNGEPDLNLYPTSLYMGYYSNLARVYMFNRTGLGTILYDSIVVKDAGSKPWIAASLDATKAEITVRVDRSGLATGRYTATLELTYRVAPPNLAQTKKEEVSVTMDVRAESASVPTPSPASSLSDELRRRVQEYIDRIDREEGVQATASDYGAIILVLQDPIRCPDITSEGCEGLLTTVTSLESRYVFTFPSVPPGNYILWAGTDDDGNGLIGDAGEFLGRFPTPGVTGEVLMIESGQALEDLGLTIFAQ